MFEKTFDLFGGQSLVGRKFVGGSCPELIDDTPRNLIARFIRANQLVDDEASQRQYGGQCREKGVGLHNALHNNGNSVSRGSINSTGFLLAQPSLACCTN